MQEGMTYQEYREYREVERIRARRKAESNRPRERMATGCRTTASRVENLPLKITQLKAVLLAYRKKIKTFDRLIERARDIMEGGNIHSSAAGLGERHGGKKSDLSDVVAKVDNMREQAGLLLGEIWEGREIISDIWNKRLISCYCYSYITEVYFDGKRKIDSVRDVRYIEQLRQAMETLGVRLDSIDTC